jgi:hypothetical protein
MKNPVRRLWMTEKTERKENKHKCLNVNIITKCYIQTDTLKMCILANKLHQIHEKRYKIRNKMYLQCVHTVAILYLFHLIWVDWQHIRVSCLDRKIRYMFISSRLDFDRRFWNQT